ncbi:MAG: hypothetical protein K5696_08820 [Lachnospiraceae bacterium]|nr:hypothetical protein [Lachnospiraceae bacterium]
MSRLAKTIRSRLSGERGQTFILVMTVTALATVLGVMAMSAALMGVRLRSMNRMADKNFYRLELALEEIRSGTARDVTSDAPQADNSLWRGRFLEEHVGIHDLSVLAEENAVRMSNRLESAYADAAGYLAGFSATIPVAGKRTVVKERTEELSITVGGISLERPDCIVFSDVQMVLINYERDAQTAIVCDLILHIPKSGAEGVHEVVGIENWRRIG